MPSALVTGSAKGIGRAFLLALAEDGYDVAINYHKSENEALELAECARSHGVKAIVKQADVTDKASVETLLDDVKYELGSLDVLVNNVGDYVFTPLPELAASDWLHMFDSNLHSTFFACQHAVSIMREQGGGRIINIGYAGSEHIIARPAIAAYGIAKTGVIIYSKALAKTEAHNNITVNIISPGIVENSVIKPVDKIPMQRCAQMEELVGAMRYFLTPEARYTTGVHIEIAGGWNV